MNYPELMEASRRFRSKLLAPLGRFLLKLKITPNQLTFLSFLSGLAAAYFLFQNPFFFALFVLLHILIDNIDGVLARLTKPTLFGDYFDHISDQLIAFLLLFKIYFYLKDYYVLIVLFLFVLTYLIYFLSRLKYPIIFVRTGLAIALMFTPLFPIFIPTAAYLVVGVVVVYSLILQLKHFLRNF